MAHEGSEHDRKHHSHQHSDSKQAPDHSYEHSHDHDHAHHHSEHNEQVSTPPLTEGACAGKTLFFDAFSGIAGDMTIAALVDLGVPFSIVEQAVDHLPITGFHLHRAHTQQSGIVATKFDVHVDTPQPERTYRSIDDMIASSRLPTRTQELARRIFKKLGEAESTVHRIALDEVHFHEVGAVDAIVDIVGSAACLVYLGVDDIAASPLPMGRGFVHARHGVLPLPAPATVSCLVGVPTYSVGLDAELVTPTGAAIIATVARRFVRWPTFAPERVGWGAGTQALPDRPNLLRVVVGTPEGYSNKDTRQETHIILEANVDDITGEMAGHAIETLLASGALDAWAVPITMKKGRPGLLISALAESHAAEQIAATLLCETTSIGVRRIPITRTERPRRMVSVDTPYGAIPVKVSEGPYGPPLAKPEFDRCAKAAAQFGVPVRTVIEAALTSLWARPQAPSPARPSPP